MSLSEQHLKKTADQLKKENIKLKAKLEKLERENRGLKKTVYDLSARVRPEGKDSSGKPRFFDISSATREDSYEGLHSSSVLDVVHNPKKVKDKRLFLSRYDYKHGGAVYAVKFSRCGKYVASGSFDRSVRVWDMSTQSVAFTCQDHKITVSSISWDSTSQKLLSGSFDQTAKIWDVTTQKVVTTFQASGLVQDVSFVPSDDDVFYVGTTHKVIQSFDARSGAVVRTLKNDALVNTLYVHQDGSIVVSGDSKGMMKAWGTKMGNVLQEVPNGEGRPISGICFSPAVYGVEEGRYFAVNSYDNVLRVYDRGLDPAVSLPTVVQTVTGHRNTGWPIKSAFFHGRGHRDYNSVGDEENEEEQEEGRGENRGEKGLHDTMVVATGSADIYAYIFDVGGKPGSASLVQKLEGHSDRVYAVDFHPVDPILATCSADATVRLSFGNTRGNGE